MNDELEIQSNIHKARMSLLFDSVPMALLGTIANAIVVAIIFSSKVSNQAIIEIWILAMMAVVVYRYVIYLKYTSSTPNTTNEKRWERLYAIGLFSTSIVWSASIILFYSETSFADHLLLAFVLGGMVSGAMTVASYKFYLYALYSVPILSTLIVYMFLNTEHHYFSWIVALFMLITLSNAMKMEENADEVEYLEAENQKLIDDLIQEKDSVKAALDDATKANSIKDLFIGNISHEFRTPLNAIQGFSQVLQHQPNIPHTMVPILKKINASGNRLLSLVEILMQYSKFKSGSFEYKPQKGLIGETVATLVNEERVRVLEKELTFDVEVGSNLVVEADFTMMKFILHVLIEDALENASAKSIIDIQASLSSEDMLDIKVCNRGPKLSEEEMEEFFDPFVHMESNHESRNLAKGLGFYISKGLVEDAHGGTFTLENNEKEGYCVVIRIPQMGTL